MSRHVDHLLSAYNDGLLAAGEAAQVAAHLVRCQRCQGRLAEHRRLAAEVHLVLSSKPKAGKAEVRQWWRGISAARARPPRHSRTLVLAPAVLVAMLLGLPLITALTDVSPQYTSASRYVDTTASAAYLDSQPVAGLIPQPQPSDQTNTVVATAAPQESAATPAPAPRAPSIQ